MKIKSVFLLFGIALILVGCGLNVRQDDSKVEVTEVEDSISSMYVEPSGDKVVLMLPLQGKLAAESKAIHNGFLAAYYYARKQSPHVSIKVLDTSSDNLAALYQQAVKSGAKVVVGPLTKDEVDVMVAMSPLPIPTIALNTLDDYYHNFGKNLYQFGLLPQDEAIQVALRMAERDYNQAAVIYPDSAWGDKIMESFRERYEGSGGQVMATLGYNPSLSLSEQLCYFLAQDPSELCVPKKHKDKKKKKNEKVGDDEDVEEDEEKPDSSETMRRQDINAIFLIAKPKDARQIIPLLKFYYAGDLPVYSISSIYAGGYAPNLDRDLDGVNFCDMPWVLQKPNYFSESLRNIYSRIKTLWPNSFANYSKLYALGVDAYNLAANLNGFLFSEDGFAGATGRLYLDRFNHIYRELKWARIRNGRPVVVK